MLTPNGRFAPNTNLCLSMTDYHPESWNPMVQMHYVKLVLLQTGRLSCLRACSGAWAPCSQGSSPSCWSLQPPQALSMPQKQSARGEHALPAAVGHDLLTCMCWLQDGACLEQP